MAYIRPFRAWRYHPRLVPQMSDLISPPFDTVSDKQRAALYQEPYNSIHLSVPDSNAEAAQTLATWKKEQVIRQDARPSIYVYYQYFTLPSEERERCRKGFICFIEAAYWSEGVVLRHEDTIPHSVEDRVDLLRATQLNASPTHGLYTDPAHRLEPLMDASMAQPVYQVEDYQGVRDVLSIIDEPAQVEQFVRVLSDKPVILADGHHRYESSLIYRQQCESLVQEKSTANGHRFHLMYLTNTESEDLRILPTHRLIRGLPSIDVPAMRHRAEPYFHWRPLENAGDVPEIIAGKPGAFGLLVGEESYKIRLKPEARAELPEDQPAEVKALDTVVLHYLFIDRVLGIPWAEQRNSPDIIYERSFAQSLYRLAKEEVQLALVTNEVSMNQVKQVCYSGHLMPQKSTYFYPKAIGGFVFGSIKDEEL